VISNDDAAEESKAERMIRKAIVHELQQRSNTSLSACTSLCPALTRDS